MKKHFKFYFLLFILFPLGTLLGFFLSQARFATQKNTNSTLPPTTTPAQNPDTNIIPPPSQALVGTVILKGTARIISRNQSDWQPLADAQKVYQDERIVLDEGRLSVNFPEILLIKTNEPISEIFLANLNPDSYVFTQTSGIFTYTTPNTISVKVGDALIQLVNGSLEVNRSLEEETTLLNLTTGSAQIAAIDPTNITRVYNLIPGQAATIDFQNRIRIK